EAQTVRRERAHKEHARSSETRGAPSTPELEETMSRCVRATLVAAALILLPISAFAQPGNIAGTVRDAQGAVMPGVLVEVTSPALIEKVRTATTDPAGQYRITSLPVGTYSVSFTLEGFTKQQRNDVVLTTSFTAPVNAVMAVGQRSELVTVTAESP